MKYKKELSRCKYGLFVHHILPCVVYSDGTPVKSIDEMAEAFDTEGFADTLAEMGVEYLIFTVWHFAVQPLYPSAVSEKWRPGNCPTKRDLMGDIIDSVNARGINVILYTHPRDGHDFSEDDKEKTGWGRGKCEADIQHPCEETFNYEKWNQYMLELYAEMADRYASRLSGYYTDSNGPKDHRLPGYVPGTIYTNTDFQIVNYISVRDIMMSRNPNLINYQNYYGDCYGNMYGNSETYGWYIESRFGGKNAEKWHCAGKTVTSLAPFSTGWTSGSDPRGKDVRRMAYEDILMYTLFNGSSCYCGGTAFATGVFAEGNLWPVGVVETFRQLKQDLAQYKDSFMDAVISLSYPTIPGSTLESNDFRFWMTGEDKNYEYLHCIRLPEDGVLEWNDAEDGIILEEPMSMTDTVKITEFVKTGNGYRMAFTGTADPIDTVFRFTRAGNAQQTNYKWYNNDSKYICYHPGWTYDAAWHYNKLFTADGCYERDIHRSYEENCSLSFAFDGNYVELYGVLNEHFGTADIYIDGVFCATVDENASEHTPRALVYRSPRLHGGTHLLQLYTHEKGFAVDAFRVIQ